MGKYEHKPEIGKVVSIPKEKAVFWMDDQGRWHNRHGPFGHKKLIDYFNASIRKDEHGYYVSQVNGDIVEKVYFRHQSTALFVVDLKWQPDAVLLLNTGATLQLDARQLYLLDDQLFLEHKGEVVKFNQRALLKLSERLDVDDQGDCWLSLKERRHKLSMRKSGQG